MYCNSFIVSLFCGLSKPNNNLDEYLYDFIIELEEIRANGIYECNELFRIKNVLFVHDASAPVWFKCFKIQTSFDSCERSKISEIYKGGKVTLTEVNSKLQTAKLFAKLPYHRKDIGIKNKTLLSHFKCTTRFNVVVCPGIHAFHIFRSSPQVYYIFGLKDLKIINLARML